MPVIPSDGRTTARVGWRSLAYTAHAFSENVDPRFPISRMADLRAFRRSTRSMPVVDFPDVSFVLDLGTDVAVRAISLEHVNFPACSITIGTTADFGPGAIFAGDDGLTTFATDGVDAEDGRQKRLVVPDEAVTCRYLHVTPLDGPTTWGAYVIGSLGVWGADAFGALPKNPGTPYRKKFDDDYDGSTTPTRVVLTFPARVARDQIAAFEAFTALARLPYERVMLWDENEGDLTKWYHMRRSDVVDSTREGPLFEFGGFQLTEVGSSDDDR